MNTSDLQSVYIAANGHLESLVRHLLLRLIDLNELKTMTARGKGKGRRTPSKIMVAVSGT